MRSARTTTTMPVTGTIARLTLSILVASLIVTPYDVRAFRSSALVAPPTIPIKIGPMKAPITQITGNDIVEDSAHNDAIVFVNNDITQKRKKKKKKIKYDLGIGRNHAINNDNNNLSSSDEGLINPNPNPTQFLVEHEAVRSYPSPINNKENSNDATTTTTTTTTAAAANNKRKKLPMIHHVRKSEDIFHIQDPTNNAGEDNNGGDNNNNNNFGDHPIIIPINNYHYLSSSSVGDDINNKSAEVVKFDLNTVWVEMMLHNEHKKLISASN